ncbi:MAG: hypothetical protein OEM62_06385, partial [Acidobacteriota bacterium]|nr:hypothetical protein [Acidobacteriota bacterium]
MTIEHLTVQRGGGSLDGGGIRSQADLTVRDARLRWNSAGGAGKGGGIYHAVSRFTGRDLTLLRTRVEDNSANLGGGVHTDNGKVVVTNSSISWNNASVGGGGLFVAAISGVT